MSLCTKVNKISNCTPESILNLNETRPNLPKPQNFIICQRIFKKTTFTSKLEHSIILACHDYVASLGDFSTFYLFRYTKNGQQYFRRDFASKGFRIQRQTSVQRGRIHAHVYNGNNRKYNRVYLLLQVSKDFLRLRRTVH